MGGMRKELLLLGVFVVIFALLSILSPSRFLNPYNLETMAFQLPEFGILALGMMVVVLTGGINLSLTATSALSGIIAAFILTSSGTSGGVGMILLTAVVAVVFGALTGLWNGAVVAYVGVTPILVTLGSMTLFEGISLMFTRGGSISGFPLDFFWLGNDKILGIPVPMVIFIALAIVMYILLERTPWGTKVYMVGSNRVAANFSGIEVKRVLLQAYVCSGILAAIASLIMLSRYNSARVDLGSGYLLQSVAAVVLGGTNIAGGYGRVVGTVVAVAILQIISSGLNILGVNRFLIDIIMGAILVVVLTLNFIQAKRLEKANARVARLSGREVME